MYIKSINTPTTPLTPPNPRKEQAFWNYWNSWSWCRIILSQGIVTKNNYHWATRKLFRLLKEAVGDS